MSIEPATRIRRAELMAALSVATDLGMGQPLEFALQSCILALRLAEKLQFSVAELRTTYYQALLRYIGCNAETRMLAAIFGDELVMRKDIIHQDATDPKYLALLIHFIRQANQGAPALRIAQAIIGGLVRSGGQINEFFTGHCEVAGRLAERLGFESDTVSALQQVYVRWDGKGVPALKGAEISPGMLVVSLAQDAIYMYRLEGSDAAVAMVQQRRGTLYAPQHVEVFRHHARELFADLELDASWDTLIRLEPGRAQVLSDQEFDDACAAIADFTDIKSPFTLGHSPGVARLAEAAARRCGLPESDALTLRRAALLHDLGRVGVSAGIWVKPGPLTEREWESVRLHAYHTERILSRPSGLAQLGSIAVLHHERLDGSGYHRGATAPTLPLLSRILAAADSYHALTETRPHRPAHTPEQASDILRWDVQRGRLDGNAVHHVLAAAGQPVSAKRKDFVAGLSEREVEVLRLIARGMSIKQIAEHLTIAPKTVGLFWRSREHP